MALTATCKKCNREVKPGDICPICGTKLPKSAIHAAWVVERKPVADWMCWNAILRWLLPAGTVVLALALLLEGVSGGTEAVEKLFLGSFPVTLLLLLGVLLLLVLAALLLQGRELVDYIVDSRGVHATRYLPDPTPLKLLLRLKSPGMMRQVDPAAQPPVLRLDEQNLPWRAVSRVQLWPEKCYILFYAPTWWLRIPVQCTPFSWEDALFYVRDKLGKKKAVDLPEHLRMQIAAKPSTRRMASQNPEPFPSMAAERQEPERGRTAAANPEAPDETDDTVPASAGEQMTLDLPMDAEE